MTFLVWIISAVYSTISKGYADKISDQLITTKKVGALQIQCSAYSANEDYPLIEQTLDGKLVANSSQIAILDGGDYAGIINRTFYHSHKIEQGSGSQNPYWYFPYEIESNRYSWYVKYGYDNDTACRFGKLAVLKFFGEDNPRNGIIDVYVNRPKDAVVVISDRTSIMLNETDKFYERNRERGNAGLDLLVNRAGIKVVAYSGYGRNKTLAELQKLKEEGVTKVIIGENESIIDGEWERRVKVIGLETRRIAIDWPPAGSDAPAFFAAQSAWLRNVTGVVRSSRLGYDAGNVCVHAHQATGDAQNYTEAVEEMKQTLCFFGQKQGGGNKTIGYTANLIEENNYY